jgi:hypothetical protein
VYTKPEDPYADYTVLDLQRPKSREKLVELICPPEQTSLGGTPCAVLDVIFRHPGVRGVVVERDYVDVDHSRSYARFYAKSFQDHIKRTTRLHFFNCRLVRKNLVELDRFSQNYLGYVVIRPLRVRRIGRTALRPPPGQAGQYHFPTLSFGAKPHIAGFEMQVRTVPSIEQDARVSACASAAIWMATAPTVERFGLQSRTTAEITELATEIDIGARLVQSEGLTPDQMLRALRGMGYEPMKIGFNNLREAIETVYPYVKSGIAPILLLRLLNGYHSVVAVGHSYDSDQPTPLRVEYGWTASDSIRVWRSWQWLPHFIIHDDQRGPYRPMRFISPSALLEYLISAGVDPRRLNAFEWQCPVQIDHEYSASLGGHPSDLRTATVAGLIGAVVPIPAGVSLSAAEAEMKVARVIRVWAQALGMVLPLDLHLRTYLLNSTEFKARLVHAEEMHPFLRASYLSKGMPHWLWVTEVAMREETLSSDPRAARIRGEILVDANSSPWIPDFVALHLPVFTGGAPTDRGLLTTMDHGDKDVAEALAKKTWVFSGDETYPRFTREWS